MIVAIKDLINTETFKSAGHYLTVGQGRGKKPMLVAGNNELLTYATLDEAKAAAKELQARLNARKIAPESIAKRSAVRAGCE